MPHRSSPKSGFRSFRWLRALAVLVVLAAASRAGRVAADSTVVFNEIHYHPATAEADSEWLELHNQMSVSMDLSRWRISGGVQFVVSGGNRHLRWRSPGDRRRSCNPDRRDRRDECPRPVDRAAVELGRNPRAPQQQPAPDGSRGVRDRRRLAGRLRWLGAHAGETRPQPGERPGRELDRQRPVGGHARCRQFSPGRRRAVPGAGLGRAAVAVRRLGDRPRNGVARAGLR
jgi:hypothetical protein